MKFLGMAILAASICAASAAQASTVPSGGISPFEVSAVRAPDAWSAVNPARGVDLPKGAAWREGDLGTSVWQLPTPQFGIDLGSGDTLLDPCRAACSPFYGGIFQTDIRDFGAPGWQTAPFWTVFAPSGDGAPETNQAVLEFAGIRSSFSLLWGSPDNSNLIEFLLGTDVVGSFAGTDFEVFGDPVIVQAPGQSAVLTSFSGLHFDSVRFTAERNGGSFEFASIAAPAPVPLPAGVVLLLTGLGAVAMASRARKARG